MAIIPYVGKGHWPRALSYDPQKKIEIAQLSIELDILDGSQECEGSKHCLMSNR